jgi:protein involved in temperature-dependent protein secretion
MEGYSPYGERLTPHMIELLNDGQLDEGIAISKAMLKEQPACTGCYHDLGLA